MEMESGRDEDTSVILIPIRASDGQEDIAVPIDDLPEDANDLIGPLKAEIAPLSVWFQCALEYYRQGYLDQFQLVLKAVLERETEYFYASPACTLYRLRMINCLVGFVIQQMWSEQNAVRLRQYEQEILDYLSYADELQVNNAEVILSKAYYLLAKYQYEAADEYFNLLRNVKELQVLVLLGKAFVHFHLGRIEKATTIYEHVIRMKPQIDPNIDSRLRLCYGYSCYKMKSFKKAEAAMLRSMELDELNVDACLGAAFSTLRQKSSTERMEEMTNSNSRYIQFISRAFEIDNENAQVLNALANHLFYQWSVVPGSFFIGQASDSISANTPVDLSPLRPNQLIRVVESETQTEWLVHVGNSDEAVKPSTIYLQARYPYPSSSRHRLYYKLYSRCFDLARRAAERARLPRVKAESYLLMGKCFHAEGDYETAKKYYHQAISGSPNLALALFHTAQIEYLEQHYDVAVDLLNRALRQYPNNLDILLLLAKAWTKIGNSDEAMKYFRRILTRDATNMVALVEAAKVLQVSKRIENQQQALNYYLTAKQCLLDRNQALPVPLSVNIGALYYRFNAIEESIQSYGEALDSMHHNGNSTVCSRVGLDEHVTSDNITILFNLAVSYEALNQYSVSITLYDRILAQFPKYFDAAVRLGNIYRDREDYKKALQYLSMAMKCGSADAHILASNIHFLLKDMVSAKYEIEEVFGLRHLKNDSYALVAMGNLLVKEDDETKMKAYKHYFYKALQLQPQNIYAANGLGIYLAKSGHYPKAQEIFHLVRETTPGFVSAWINLAILAIQQQDFETAIKLYYRAWKLDPRDRNILLDLGTACFRSQKYIACIKWLVRGVHLYPTDMRFHQNLALAQETFASSILSAGDGDNFDAAGSSVAQINRAIAYLHQAQQNFQRVSILQDEKLAISSERTTEHIQYCEEAIKGARSSLDYEEIKQDKRQAENEAQYQAYLSQLQERKKKEQQKFDNLILIEQQQQKIAKRKQARVEALTPKWMLREFPVEATEQHLPRAKKQRLHEPEPEDLKTQEE